MDVLYRPQTSTTTYARSSGRKKRLPEGQSTVAPKKKLPTFSAVSRWRSIFVMCLERKMRQRQAEFNIRQRQLGKSGVQTFYAETVVQFVRGILPAVNQTYH